MAVGAGLAVNDEQGVDVRGDPERRGAVHVRDSFYRLRSPEDQPRLNLQYYPSLSDPGRRRVQLDASARREFWKDLFVGLTLFNSYDSRPPNPASSTNDVGVVLSIGWTY